MYTRVSHAPPPPISLCVRCESSSLAVGIHSAGQWYVIAGRKNDDVSVNCIIMVTQSILFL